MRVRQPSQQGYVVIWLTVSLVTLLILSAFVVDIGNWYLTRDRAQKAADAAAIAAAAYLPDNFAGACRAAGEEAQRNGFELFTTPNTLTNNLSEMSCAARNGANPVQFDLPDKITISLNRTVGTFFARFAGITEQNIGRSATAQYSGPVLMGSPSNVLGNEPIRTNSTGDWTVNSTACPSRPAGSAANRNPGTPQVGRNQANTNNAGADEEWRPCFDNGAGFWLNTHGTNTPDAQGEPTGTYEFVVDVTRNGSAAPLLLEMYDPMFYNVGSSCDVKNANGPTGTAERRFWRVGTSPRSLADTQVGYQPIQSSTSVQVGNDWGRFIEGTGRFCNGDSPLRTLCGINGGSGPGTIDFSRSESEVPIILAQAGWSDDCRFPSTQVTVTTDTGADMNASCPNSGSWGVGTNDRSYVGQDVNTGHFANWYQGHQRNFMAFANWEGAVWTPTWFGGWWVPNGSFFEGRVNGVGGDPAGEPNLVVDDWNGWTYTRFLRTVRAWDRLCSVNSTVGTSGTERFTIRVAASAGHGANRYALRARLSGVNVNDSANYVQVYGKGALPMYMNRGSGRMTLAKVTPGYAGKTLRLTFFDPGDATLGSAGGTFTLRPPADAQFGGGAHVGLSGNWGCNWFVMDAAGTSMSGLNTPTGDTVAVPYSGSSTTDCSIGIPRSYPNGNGPPGATSAQGWNGHTVVVDIPIPTNYTCDIEGDDFDAAAGAPGLDNIPDSRTGCWVAIDIAGFGGTLSDATVWTASIAGDPIRLVE